MKGANALGKDGIMASLKGSSQDTINRLDHGVNGQEAMGIPMIVLTMGCRVNQFESATMGQGGTGRGFRLVDAGQPAALVVINTCSVTSESDRQARQLIRRAVRDYPDSRIVVTGCYAQRAPEILADLPGVDLVLGNGEKSRLWELLAEMPPMPHHPVPGEDATSRVRVGNIADLTEMPDSIFLDHFGDRTRAFLHAQDGCDRACTYCLIPHVRGPSRSVPVARVMEQARRFIASGYEEIVLTGVDLGAYGRDLDGACSLASLVRELLGLPGLGRLRISSVDPLDLDEAWIGLLADSDRLCGYLHLSIQSGDDGVRKRMGRGRGRQEVMRQIARIRAARPDVVLGADFIVGFPSETEAAFAQTLELIAEAGLSLLHVFPYSARPKTVAASWSRTLGIPADQIRTRAQMVRQAGATQWAEVAKLHLGRQELVLVESVEAGWGIGKTDGFLDMRFPQASVEWRGCLLPVTTVGLDAEKQTLIGRVNDEWVG
ncbi:MAG: tRNA (N(6)-L-threonylcarbamoyladenosine(37)-C(2))-methylthiotransferase MtaB [Magnetococcus sp. YQC-5]